LESDNLLSGDNAFNGRYGKEFEFVINGKDSSRNELLLRGQRCLNDECPVPEINDGILLEKDYRLWSDPVAWGGVVPKAGDSVEIKATWNMLLDIPNPPPLASLTINGRLTFKDHQDVGDVTLRAKNIWVQSGQLYIGAD
jgi:hypothetical protein